MANEVKRKELIVGIYEKFFFGQDVTQGKSNFWDEFFLLKPNIKALKNLFDKTSIDTIEMIRPQIQRLFAQCLNYLTDSVYSKIANSIQTMDCILLCLSMKLKQDVLVFLLNKESDCSIKFFANSLVDSFNYIVNQTKSPLLKTLVLNSFTLIVSLYPKMEDNSISFALLEMPSFIDSLNEINSHLSQRLQYGKYSCQIFGILLKHQKDGQKNHLAEYLSQLNDELILNGLSFTISYSLSQANLMYRQKTATSTGFISSISSIFSSKPALDISQHFTSLSYESLILFLHELIVINPNNAHNILLYSHKNNPTTKNFINGQSADLEEESNESTRTSMSNPIEDFEIMSLNNNNNSSLINRKTTNSLSPDSSLEDEDEDTNLHNVLADFLEYTSIIISDVKELLLLTEFSFDLIRTFINNQKILALIHDTHTLFDVIIHRIKTRHRNSPETTTRNLPAVIFILDLVIEFTQNNLMRNFPFYIYENCLQTIHGLLVYQKEIEIHIEYDWKVLWISLLNTAKYLTELPDPNSNKTRIFNLLSTIMKIFNIFILYSSELLKSPEQYDYFNYELIRMEKSIEKIYNFALSHTQSSDYKTAAMTLINNMGNMRAVAKHFLMKIDNFTKAQNIASLTEQQVLSIIQDNYESLNLRVYEDLEKVDQINPEDIHQKHELFVESIREKIRGDYVRFSTEIQMQFTDI